MAETKSKTADIKNQKCNYKECNEDAVTSGCIFARRSGVKNGLPKFIELFACEKHSELDGFYCDEKL